MPSTYSSTDLIEKEEENMEKEEENRFLLLLQPNRDLAANWAVDVGRELEIYLEGLALSSRPHHEGCLDASFNFAQGNSLYCSALPRFYLFCTVKWF